MIACHPERSEGSPAVGDPSPSARLRMTPRQRFLHALRTSAVKTEAWIARLFLVVALMQIVPVWSAPYFPTADGPAHLYNAWVMRELVLGHDNAVTRTYAIDAKPYPNLLDHLALAVLLGEFPPPVAEKVFVSGIVPLFLGGLWLFAGAVDPRASLFAFLGVPLAHHLLLQSGFYNFSLGAGLYFITVAVWWRRRKRDDGQTIVIVAILLLLCYFAHPMPALLAIGTIGLLWLAALRGRHARHLLAFVPVLPLLAWFLLHQRGGGRHITSAWHHLTFLAQTQDVVTFDPRQLRFGDIVSLDIGVVYNRFIGDTARTVAVGGCGVLAQKLMDVAEKALYEGIAQAVPGKRVVDISRAIQKYVEGNGFSVVREFVGHGVGRTVHEDPQVPNFVDGKSSDKLRPGMTLAIEPMVNAGLPAVKILNDGWTVVTQDGSLSAHFEHTVLITESEPEILTWPERMPSKLQVP